MEPTVTSNLHIFGCSAIVHVPAEKRKKLDPKGKKLTFVGYADNHKAFRFIDPTTDKITISRDAKFIEMEELEEIKYSEDPDPQIVEYQSEIVPQFDVDSMGEDNTDETLVEEEQTDVDASMYDTPNEDEDDDSAAADATFDEKTDRESRHLGGGFYFRLFSTITQSKLNQLTQFFKLSEIGIVSTRVQHFKSIGLKLNEL